MRRPIRPFKRRWYADKYTLRRRYVLHWLDMFPEDYSFPVEQAAHIMCDYMRGRIREDGILRSIFKVEPVEARQ